MFRRSIPFLILAAALVAFNFSLGMSRTIQGNFLVDELGVKPNEMAIVITARETVGFLTILLVAATMRFAPARLASVCFVVMGVGYYLYGVATSYAGVLPGVILASAGFHIWSTLNSAFGLAVAKEEDAGQVLGDLQSIGFIAGLVGIAVVYVGVSAIGYPNAFAVAGISMLVGAIVIFRFPGHLVHISPQRMVIRRRYGLFYILNFFQGCRFEFYQAFGVFLLIEHYKMSVQTIAILFVATSIGNVVFSPIIGRAIDRYGEQPVMSVGYVGMFATFLGFALWNNAGAAIGLYFAYNSFILVEIGVNTYLKKVAAPAMSDRVCDTGLTVMHIPALIVPILGGVLWNTFGYAVPFLVGCIFIAASLVATQLMPRRTVASVSQPAVV